MATRAWSFGDKVVHATKPEWGIGVVTGASDVVHEGTPCQRVVVRFERVGVKTLSTAFAELRPAPAPVLTVAEEEPEPATAQAGAASGASHPTFGPTTPPTPALGADSGAGGWLDKAAAPNPIEVMCRLPEATNDPFTPLAARLKATMNLYRFTDSGASLLDWAAAQSGLKDPLSRFNRHELEQLFRRFTFVRDDHLKRIVLDMKRQDPAGLQQALRAAPAPVQQALRRLDVGR
jgi:hypothetical protein